MGVCYICTQCDAAVEYSPADYEDDPHRCPHDEPATPWESGVVMALIVGVIATATLAVVL